MLLNACNNEDNKLLGENFEVSIESNNMIVQNEIEKREIIFQFKSESDLEIFSFKKGYDISSGEGCTFRHEIYSLSGNSIYIANNKYRLQKYKEGYRIFKNNDLILTLTKKKNGVLHRISVSNEVKI
jgi:hypothetical protein